MPVLGNKYCRNASRKLGMSGLINKMRESGKARRSAVFSKVRMSGRIWLLFLLFQIHYFNTPDLTNLFSFSTIVEAQVQRKVRQSRLLFIDPTGFSNPFLRSEIIFRFQEREARLIAEGFRDFYDRDGVFSRTWDIKNSSFIWFVILELNQKYKKDFSWFVAQLQKGSIQLQAQQKSISSGISVETSNGNVKLIFPSLNFEKISEGIQKNCDTLLSQLVQIINEIQHPDGPETVGMLMASGAVPVSSAKAK
jgi:hypothetical protein